MAIYKDGENWRAVYRYTDWTGERKQTQKRGFKTKRKSFLGKTKIENTV